ncbi:MAG: LysR family transcriptional regulator [Pseudolabrys sp.]|nr:LysR family transcriptional regulator [Pseudolabrys sp.]
MTLDQLRIFVAVAECEHMTRAAEGLRLTQSAVSGAIHSLEARHDVLLFQRVGRRIELTQAGRTFLDEARTVLRTAEAAELALLDLRGLKRGVINLHASQTTGAYWLPERIARFQVEHPNIDIRLSLGNTDQVAAAVSSGAAEIGFIEGTIDQPDLVTEQVDVDQLVIVTGVAHPWSQLRRIGNKHITATKWVLRERGSGTRSVFEQALVRLGIPLDQLNVALELPSNEAIRGAVEAGAGATAMSRVVVKSALRLKSLHAVKFAPLERPFVLIKHRDRSHSNAVRAFLTMIANDKPKPLNS